MGGGPPGIAHFGRGGLKPEIFDIFCLKFDLQGPWGAAQTGPGGTPQGPGEVEPSGPVCAAVPGP